MVFGGHLRGFPRGPVTAAAATDLSDYRGWRAYPGHLSATNSAE